MGSCSSKAKKDDLRDAAIDGDFATLTRLVDEGVDINAVDRGGNTALMGAAHWGELACLDHLVAKGAKLDVQDNSKRTALHWAAAHGRAPCVASLLKAGADTSLKDKNGDTALDDAKILGHPEIVRLLQDAAAAQAAKEKEKEEKKKEEEEKWKEESKEIDLRVATMSGDLATLTRLVDEGVDINAGDGDGETALMRAARGGELDCLDHLVAKGAKLDVQDNEKNTALHWAANKGYTPCVASLLKAGADTSLKDKDGATALANAKVLGHPEIVRLLEDAAAAQAKKEGDLRTAAKEDDLATLTRLVDEGVDIDAGDKEYGETALMEAVWQGHLACLDHLVAKGAKLEAQDKKGRTALMKAARAGHLACLDRLVAKGAKLDVQDKDGNTALDDAKKLSTPYPECARLLEDAAAAQAKKAAAEKAAAEKAAEKAAGKAAACGLLQPLKTMSLDATSNLEAAVTFCEKQGAASVADLVEYDHLDGLTNALGLKPIQAMKLKDDLKAAAEKATAEKAAAEKAAALGLLQPLKAMSLDATSYLEAAVAYCEKQGAASVAELVECDLLDGLADALGLKPVQAKKLKVALKAPQATRTPSSPNETRTIAGVTYTIIEQLNPGGNATIWRVKDEQGHTYVLKVSNAESVKSEVAARNAVGWGMHERYLLKMYANEGDSMILEAADVTLRKRLKDGKMTGLEAVVCISHVLEGLKQLHERNVVHLDIKPENIFRVKDHRTGDPVWKLGDLDAHRKQGDPIGDITCHYAAPEVAKAILGNATIGADPKMDIFSLGLVAYEMLGAALFPASTYDKAAALSALAGSGLEPLLQKGLGSLPKQQHGFLRSMLTISPVERKAANLLLNDGVITGNFTTSSYAAGFDELKKQVKEAEQRLHEQVREGNEEVIKQMRQMQREALPQLLSAVKQHALELRCCKEGLSDDELAEVQAAAHEALMQAAEQAKGRDESLRKMMEEMLAGGGPAAGQGAEDMLEKLDALAARMESMQAQFTELGGKMDAQAEAQAADMAKLSEKLNQLLLGEHEQVFRKFMLIPMPKPKGFMGKMLRNLDPRKWLSHDMILVPYYTDAAGVLKPAPLQGDAKEAGGFWVPRPKDFVENNPRAVMFAMWFFKAGVKVATTQLCITVPAKSLEALGDVTNDLLKTVLSEGITYMQDLVVDEDGKLTESMEEKLDKMFEEPEDVIDKMVSNENFATLSKLDYKKLKEWMDTNHPSWERNCGLVQQTDEKTGRVEWLPRGGGK